MSKRDWKTLVKLLMFVVLALNGSGSYFRDKSRKLLEDLDVEKG